MNNKFPDDNWGIRVENIAEGRDASSYIQSLKPEKNKDWNGSGTCYYIKDGTLDCMGCSPEGCKIFTYKEFREILDGPKEPIIIDNYELY